MNPVHLRDSLEDARQLLREALRTDRTEFVQWRLELSEELIAEVIKELEDEHINSKQSGLIAELIAAKDAKVKRERLTWSR